MVWLGANLFRSKKWIALKKIFWAEWLFFFKKEEEEKMLRTFRLCVVRRRKKGEKSFS